MLPQSSREMQKRASGLGSSGSRACLGAWLGSRLGSPGVELVPEPGCMLSRV